MTTEQIEKFLKKAAINASPVRISFKTRKPVVGFFIKTADYGELKSKNFWRIVGELNFENYQVSKDMNLARIFRGHDFAKLSAL